MRIVLDGNVTAADLHRVMIEMATETRKEWWGLAKYGATFMRGPGSEGRFLNRTGSLRKSMSGELTIRGPFDMTVDILADTKYAKAIDEGAKAHAIVARRAPYLKFYWARMGRWVRCKRVWHPGITGRYFSKRTERALVNPFGLRTQDAINSVARGT